MTSIKTSTESHLYWKKNSKKVKSFSRVYADVEADIAIKTFI